MNAVLELERAGYSLTIDGDQIRYALAPGREVDAATVKPMLEELRAHKEDAITFLRQRDQSPTTLYQTVSDKLAATYQAGTRQYIEQHRPELAQEIDAAEAEVNRSWLACEDGAGSLDDFKYALAAWKDANLRAIRAYNDSLPLTLAGADPAEEARAKEQLRRQGYFLMHSQALGERIAVVEHDRFRQDVPQGIPIYALAEIRLLQQGVKAGTVRTIADLRLLHETKKKLGAVVIS